VIESGGTSSPAAPPAGGGTVGAWINAWQPEDAVLLAARQRAGEVGVGAVDPATGAALRMLAAATHATSAVELGTGAGVSSLWLLRGMAAGGILTTVDSESEHQRLAKAAFAEAAVPSGRVRVIAGRALDVVPRLSDSAYDVVFCDAARSENLDYLNAAMRLLRPGGVVVFADALGGGRIAESSARDAETVAMRELARAVREETRLAPAMLPVSNGLLVAALLG
jgi:predicted O-methyltransferase YrrM